MAVCWRSFVLGALASSVVVLVSVASKHCKIWWRYRKVLRKSPALIVLPPPRTPPRTPKKNDKPPQIDNSGAKDRIPACQAAFELLCFIDQSGSSLAPLVRMSDQDRVQQQQDQAAELATLYKRWIDSKKETE